MYKTMMQNGTAPYFYYQIRALFRSVGGTVFEFAQEYLVPNGTFKATVLENHYSFFRRIRTPYCWFKLWTLGLYFLTSKNLKPSKFVVQIGIK
jgi:hypothetical protein